MAVGVFERNVIHNLNILKYSLLTGFFIGLYSLIDGYGARVSLSGTSYMSWSFTLNALIFPILLKLKKNENIFKRVIKEGKLNYCLKALRDKGLIKIENFKKNPHKVNYIYVLTPAGISTRTKLTLNFMKRKMKEYDELKKEIKR